MEKQKTEKANHSPRCSAEVDYVAVIDGQIYPIEVKSGSSGRLKSLHLFLQTYKNTPEGIVFSMRPYAELPEKNITFVPLYFAFSATAGNLLEDIVL